MEEYEVKKGTPPRKVLPHDYLLQDEQGRIHPAFAEMYDEVLGIFFAHDPIGINFGHNNDEYAPEARTILQRMKEAVSPESLTKIIHEEFVRWFDAEMAGPQSRYEAIAHDVWASWQRYQSKI